jgi:hypothetical protein
MGETAQRSRSRASREPYRHFSDGHIVKRRITPATIEMIARIFSRRRYCTPAYAAALLDLNYNATCVRFKGLREESVKVLKLCEPQETDINKRIIGNLYSELDIEGYALLNEEGMRLKPHKPDGHFAHSLARDLVMLSVEIGVAHDDDIEMEYRDDLPGSFRLSKDNFMVCDERPVTFTSKTRGTKRHIAGVEIETGANSIAPKDANDASVIRKVRNMIWLIESGELERTHHFGKQFFWAFVFRTDVRKESSMQYLADFTRHNPELRKHFIFKRHPIFGKSKDKPRATGHMFTEPWARVEKPSLYLNGGESNARQ